MTSKEFLDIKTLLSYNLDAKKIFFSGKTFDSRRYLIDKKGKFPSGLVHRVEQYLKHHNKQFLIVENRQPPKPSKSLYKLVME